MTDRLQEIEESKKQPRPIVTEEFLQHVRESTLKDIQHMLDRITPGEWYAHRPPRAEFDPDGEPYKDYYCLRTLGRDDEAEDCELCIACDIESSPDAKLISRAPGVIRWLLEEVKRLRGEPADG